MDLNKKVELTEKYYKVLDKNFYRGRGRPRKQDYDKFIEFHANGVLIRKFMNGINIKV